MRIRRTALLLYIITVLLPAISHAGGPQEVGARLTVEAIYGENPLTGEDPSDFQWSPDNGMLSFLLEDEEETRLLAMDLDSGKPEKLAETLPSTGDSETDQALVTEIAAYHWSPDGRRLLAETGRLEILLVDASPPVPTESISSATKRMVSSSSRSRRAAMSGSRR